MNVNWENTKSKLSDPKRAFTLVDARTGQTVVRNATGEDITSKYGSFEEFEKSIFDKGIKTAKIINRTFNGMSGDVVKFKNQGDEPYTINFDPTNTEQVVSSVPAVSTNFIAPVVQAGLSGTGGIGLGGYYQADYPRVVQLLQKLEEKCENLTAENLKMEKEILSNKLLDGKSVERNQSTANLVEKFTPLAMAMMEKLTANQTPALPQGLSGASPAKVQSIQSILQCDEATVHYLSKLSEKLEDDAVWTDFEHLLKKHLIVA